MSERNRAYVILRVTCKEVQKRYVGFQEVIVCREGRLRETDLALQSWKRAAGRQGFILLKRKDRRHAKAGLRHGESAERQTRPKGPSPQGTRDTAVSFNVTR